MAPSLPLEIWIEIVACLDKAELQTIRLTSKAHNACATPILFKCLHLNASTESLRQAYAIAASPVLAAAVTHLWLFDDTIEEECDDLDQFKERVRGGLLNDAEWAQDAGCDPSFDYPEHPFSPMMEHYHGYLARVADQKAFRACAGTTKLWSFLRQLPNVRHLERIVPDGLQCTALSVVTHRRILSPSRFWADRDFFPLAQIPTICKGFGLRSLALKPVNLENFEFMWSAQAQQSLQATFCELRKLSIRLLMNDNNSHYGQQSFRYLQSFLAATQTIEQLSLDFEAAMWGDETAKEEAATDVLLGQHWPKLRCLKIENFHCTETQLVSFVDRNASNLDVLTLQSLKIRQPMIIPHARAHSSAIRAIWRMGQLSSFHPRQCWIRGYLSTDCVEQWCHAVGGETKSGLREQFQEYICRRGPYPYGSLSKPLFSLFPRGRGKNAMVPKRKRTSRSSVRERLDKHDCDASSTDPWTLDDIDRVVVIINHCLEPDEVAHYFGDHTWPLRPISFT